MTKDKDTKEMILKKMEEVLDTDVKAPDLNGNRHPEELKLLAKAMRASGYTYHGIAAKLNVSAGSVHDWVNRVEERRFEDTELTEQIKAQMSGKVYSTANHILSKVSDEDIERATLQQKATSFGIMIDKARLIEGQSTENHSMIVKEFDKASGRGEELDDEALQIEAEIARIEES